MFKKIKKLFKKENKHMANLDEMLKSLSDEEKKELRAKLQDLDKAEDEREIDKIEEEKADSSEKADEKKEEKNEESEEIGKDVDEIEEKIEEEKAEEESHEERQEEKHEEHSDGLKRLEEKVDKLFAMFENIGKSSVEEKAKEVYGLGNGVFQEEKQTETKKTTPSEVAGILSRIKR